MEGKELWGRVFNTDLEESVLAHLGLEKDFEDEGTDEENSEIVEALEGFDLSHIIDWHCQYIGCGIDSSDVRSWIEMLQIEDIETIKDWN